MNSKKTKICKECGELKPLSEFTFNINMKDGYTNVCHACKREATSKKWEDAKKDIWSFNLISGYKNNSSHRLHDLRIN